MRRPFIFRSLAFVTDGIALVSVVVLLYGVVWNYATAQYVAGFADSLVAVNGTAHQKCEALLKWVASTAPASRVYLYAAHRSPFKILPENHGPYDCGSYTNTFVKLATAAGMRSRRLLLLDSVGATKHVLAEVWLDNRWVVTDPTTGAFFIAQHGRLLTKEDLRDAATFRNAIGRIPGYEADDDFSHATHIRLERVPFFGHQLRRALDQLHPGWDDAADWGYLPDHPPLWPILASMVLFPFGTAARILLDRYERKTLRLVRGPLHQRLYGVAQWIRTGQTDRDRMVFHT